MKQLMIRMAALLLLTGIASCGGDDYDDSILKEQIAQLEKRIEAAETVLKAYNNNLFIKSVQQTSNGYIITFSDGSKATITNGKDGIDGNPGAAGDTWIKHVTIGTTDVTFEMTDGRTFTIPLASLVQSIQHLSYVPRTSNGQIEVSYSSADDSRFTFDFCLSPSELTSDLYAKWQEMCSVKAVLTATRGVDVIELTIVGCEADTTTGILSFEVSASALGNNFFSYGCSAAAALVVSDGASTLTSDFINLTACRSTFPANQIRYTTSNNQTTTPSAAIAAGVSITANSYTDGIGTMTFSENLTSIATSAFAAHKTLRTIELPEGVQTIGQKAFQSCKMLFRATIPASVTSIESHAFAQSVLTEVTILGRPTIGQFAFSNCKNTYGTHLLRAFYGPLASADNRALVDNGTLLSYASGSGNDYVVPADVTRIGATAFANCDKITSITLPEGVQTIETYAFYYCYALASINIPEGVVTIGDYAFMGDRSLKELTLPASIQTLGARALGGCSALTTLTIHATTPPSLGAQALASTSSTMRILVPASAVTAYREHEDWAAYAAQIEVQ